MDSFFQEEGGGFSPLLILTCKLGKVDIVVHNLYDVFTLILLAVLQHEHLLYVFECVCVYVCVCV